MLRCALGKSGRDWDKLLPSIQLAMNSLYNETLGDSPFHLMFGTNSRLGLDHVWTPYQPINTLYQIIAGKVHNPLKYQKIIRESLDTLHACAEENLTKQSKYYNKSHRPKFFNIGDTVLFRNHPKSDKAKGIMASLEPKWSSPCIVIEKLGDNSYVLMDMDTKIQVDYSYHVNDLKRYIVRENGDVSSSNLSGDEEIDFDKLEGLYLNPPPVEELPENAPREIKALKLAPRLRGKRVKNTKVDDIDTGMDQLQSSTNTTANQECKVRPDLELIRPLEANNPLVADNLDNSIHSSGEVQVIHKINGEEKVVTSSANSREKSKAVADKSNSLQGTFKDITRSGLHPLMQTDRSNITLNSFSQNGTSVTSLIAPSEGKNTTIQTSGTQKIGSSEGKHTTIQALDTQEIGSSGGKLKPEKIRYEPILPDLSSNSDSNPQQTIAARVKRHPRRVRKPLIEINNIQYDCFPCSQLIDDFNCNLHAGEVNKWHCEECSEEFHRLLQIKLILDPDQLFMMSQHLCQECMNRFESYVKIRKINSLRDENHKLCIFCPNELINRPITVVNAQIFDAIEEKFLCQFKAYDDCRFKVNMDILHSQVKWDCYKCSEFMKLQEANLSQFDVQTGKIKLHCPDCEASFHKVAGDFSEIFNVPYNLIHSFTNEFICLGCTPILMLEGGVKYRDLNQLETPGYGDDIFQFYRYNPINMQIKNGYILSENLLEDDINNIVYCLRQDNNGLMDRIIANQPWFDRCENCANFPNFHLFTKDEQEFSIELSKKLHSNTLVIYQKCHLLWYFYLRFINPDMLYEEGRKEMRHALFQPFPEPRTQNIHSGNQPIHPTLPSASAAEITANKQENSFLTDKQLWDLINSILENKGEEFFVHCMTTKELRFAIENLGIVCRCEYCSTFADFSHLIQCESPFQFFHLLKSIHDKSISMNNCVFLNSYYKVKSEQFALFNSEANGYLGGMLESQIQPFSVEGNKPLQPRSYKQALIGVKTTYDPY